MNHHVAASRMLAPTPLNFDQGGPFACPAGVEPSRWRSALAQRLETLLDLQTAMIAALDTLDGDPDLEDEPDLEPSIGGNVLNHLAIDCEADDADDEPSLGSQNPIAPWVVPLGFWQVRPHWISPADWAKHLHRHDDIWSPRTDCQLRWAAGRGDDREDEHDGAEIENEHGGDVQDEPHDEEPDREWSLGWGFGADHQGAGYLSHGQYDADREADHIPETPDERPARSHR